MPHPLESFRLKLNRAHHHAEALQRETQAWLKQHPYEVFGEYEPGLPEEYVFRVRFFELPSPEWGIVLGDFAHNARSALDHLAYQLVRAGGGTATQTQFPILLVPWDWPSRGAPRLQGASERHVSIVESLQPYHRRDLYGYSSGLASIDDPLAILSRLSNVDKHRVLHAALVTLEAIGYDLAPVNDVAAIDLNRASVSWESLIDGAELLRVPITSTGPRPEVEMNRSETVEVALRYITELDHGSFIETRINLHQSLGAILDKLRSIFEIFVREFR